MRAWVHEKVESRADVLRAGYFGSYARGDWGVGSDVDIVVVVEHDPRRFEERNLEWDTVDLPVPADVLVYTREEFERILGEERRLARVMRRETVWILGDAPPPR